jgi:hypothetical protein
VLRGTVPEMLEFAWRVYHIQGPADLLALTDVSTRCSHTHSHTHTHTHTDTHRCLHSRRTCSHSRM